MALPLVSNADTSGARVLSASLLPLLRYADPEGGGAHVHEDCGPLAVPQVHGGACRDGESAWRASVAEVPVRANGVEPGACGMCALFFSPYTYFLFPRALALLCAGHEALASSHQGEDPHSCTTAFLAALLALSARG